MSKSKSIYSTTSHILHQLEDPSDSSTKATLANLRESIMQDSGQSSAIWQLLFENISKEFLSRTGEMTPAERSIISALQLYALHQQGETSPRNVASKKSDPDLGTFHVRFRDGKFVIDRRIFNDKDQSLHRSFEHGKEVHRQFEIWQGQMERAQAERKESKQNSGPAYVKDLGESLHQLRIQYDDTQAVDRRFNTMIATGDYDELVGNLRSLIGLLKSKTTATVDYSQLAHDLFRSLSSSQGANQVKMNWSQSYFYQKGDQNYDQ